MTEKEAEEEVEGGGEEEEEKREEKTRQKPLAVNNGTLFEIYMKVFQSSCGLDGIM